MTPSTTRSSIAPHLITKRSGTPATPPRSRLADEDGFTLIEVLVAALLMVVGIVATLQMFTTSSHITLTAQREQAAMTAAEQAMEQIRALPYASMALATPLPSHESDGNATGDSSGNPTDPNYWVNSTGSTLKIPSNFSSEASSTLSSGETLISGGSVSPGPSSVSSNGYTVKVYRYITWVNDVCTYLSSDLCSGTQDAKRITVAAVISGTQASVGVQKPVWLTTVAVDPNAAVG